MADGTSSENILNQLFDCVHSGVGWVAEQLKSACPSKQKKPEKSYTETETEKDDEESDIGPPCTEGKLYTSPRQICPRTFSCCFIKMQDPYAPCCCETKPQLPPCPPKCHRRESREPICGCDLCKKKCADSRCCDQIAAFRGRVSDPRYFEKA